MEDEARTIEYAGKFRLLDRNEVNEAMKKFI